MRERLRKLTLTDRLFLAALVFWMCAYFCYERTFLAIYIERFALHIDFLTMTLLFAAEIIRPKRNIWCLAGLAAIAFCAFAATRANTNAIVTILFFIYVGRGTDFRVSAFISFITICVLTISVTGLALIGFLPDPTFTGGGRVRHCLGFRYPLYPAQLIFIIACLWAYLRGTRISVAEILFLFLSNYAFYLATDSRLSFVLTACLLALVLIIKFFSYASFFDRLRNVLFHCAPLGIILSSCFIACAIFSIAITLAYDPANELMQHLDTIFGGRLKYGYQGFTEYGVPWGGQFVATNGNGLAPDGSSYVTPGSYFYIDCLYDLILVRYGFIFFILFIASLTAACWYAWKTKQGFMLLALIFIAAHCIVDDLAFYLFFDPFLLLAGYAPAQLLKLREETASNKKQMTTH